MQVMSAPTKPKVDTHASDASFWVKVRVRLEPSTAHGWVGISMDNVTRTRACVIRER